MVFSSHQSMISPDPETTPLGTRLCLLLMLSISFFRNDRTRKTAITFACTLELRSNNNMFLS